MTECDCAHLVWVNTPLHAGEVLSIAYKLAVWDQVSDDVHEWMRKRAFEEKA